MGIQMQLPVTPVAAENRTWRIQIECGFDMQVAHRWVRYHREVVPLDAEGARAGDINQSRVPVGNGFLPLEVTATYAQLGGRSFTAAGATVTGAQMMALIALVGDTLWQESVAAELARQEAEAEPEPEPVEE